MPLHSPISLELEGSVHRKVILFAKLASPEDPQELSPAQRFPLTSRYVPLGKITVVPG